VNVPGKRLVGDLLEDLRSKARWCYQREDTAGVLKALAADGTGAMICYRLMQASRRRGLVPLELLFNKLNVAVNHCIIGRGAEFGPGFVLIHAEGVVINGTVRGGSHVHLEHQVTIGAERRRSPVLGNDLFIGAGAKVIGAVNIGDGAKVGANAVVVHDVPPATTVVGIPARPVKKALLPS
jgi:serine O-acetyltransferase